MNKIYIGTTGWNYQHWKEVFYPSDLPQSESLEFYAKKLNSVELNNSFYRLPDKGKFEKWRESVPKTFKFAVKASRYITHVKKLNDTLKPVTNLIENANGLGINLGPILFQLQTNWKSNPERLENFLRNLPQNHTYAIEFRHKTWLNEDTYKLLEKHRVAFVIHDYKNPKTPEIITANLIYLRFHGPNGNYEGKYEKDFIKNLAQKISNWHDHGHTIYCYFNNDQNGYAAANACELARELEL